MPALRFKTCRLLPGNVRNRELSLIQRRILRRLRNKRRSIKRNLSQRENLNSNIKSQTTRKLSLYYGDLPIRKMHRGRERTSYIPFLLNQETRSDVIPVRLRFSDTLPQARQPISHRRVCLNNGLVTITHFKVSHGDLISFKENDARTRGEEIRRSFYIDISVGKIIGKFLPVRIWRRTKTEWFRLLTTQRGCRLLLKSGFLQELRSYMQEEDLERTKKFGSAKVCLGSSFAEHNRMKRNLFHFKYFFLWKRRKEEEELIRTIGEAEWKRRKEEEELIRRKEEEEGVEEILKVIEENENRKRAISPFVYTQKLYRNSTYCSGSPFTRKIRIKRIELPTHYSEVNHRTLKAVVSYGPNIGHIPHDIRLKDPNLPLRSGNGRGQNI
uniref:Ribosomal protein S4 n=1 Tax=Saccharum officinarum TaxID=4547 RepID=A0A2Z5QFN4_SACOF|nr:ribosomal protein S4 [Saccharum hybrid cultivar x Tripidium arundinaceum]QXP99596.1 ribosomal protein S4 [Saccharum hybrid cultivar]UDD86418.1 ribosomal protein S4 [Saccharum officinarum]UHB41480.1 ribosomal protein S4 [Saccharum hybrid cultivar]UHB41513.1 ribosomal protein S4 [Saccharum hybrid cultivar]